MPPTQTDLEAQARHLLDLCADKGLMIGAVESCTGGLVAATLTEIPGSSRAVAAGLVTYSNAAKTALAGVPEDLLVAHGAVSEPVARAMAEGGRARMGVDLCVAITGVAGPGGGSAEKPVGLVHFACAARGCDTIHRAIRFGDLGRATIRAESVMVAFDLLKAAADQAPATVRGGTP